MPEFRWLFEKDIVIAHLTQACVSHSYKVETIKDISAIWLDLKQGVTIRDDVDLLCGMLACGRIMDLKEEINTHTAVTNIIRSIRIEVEKENIIPNSTDKEFMFAHISAAVVENMDKVLALREIVKTWMDIRDTLEINSNMDLVCGFLTVGRILELSVEIENSDSVKNIFMMLHGELKEMKGLEEFSYNEYAAGVITSAYVEITPKLEKIRDIINTWQWARENIPIENKLDFIAAILAAGRIKDLDAKHMLLQESLSDIIGRIKERIEVELL